MPMLCIKLSLESYDEDNDDNKQKNQIFIPLKSDNFDYINIHKDQDYILNIIMKRKNKSNNLKAHCPLFQKGKDEGWFLILGNISNKELLVLKRASAINEQRKYQLQFTAPSKLGNFIFVYIYDYLSMYYMTVIILFFLRTNNSNVLFDFRLLHRIRSTI